MGLFIKQPLIILLASEYCMIEGGLLHSGIRQIRVLIYGCHSLLMGMYHLFLLYVYPDVVVTMYDLGLSNLSMTIAGAQVLSSNCTHTQTPG